MRLLMVIALFVVAVQSYPMGGIRPGGGYQYGQGGGMEGGYGREGYMTGAGGGSRVFDNTSRDYKRTEEIHDSRVAGANKNGGFLNQGGRNYGYDRSGANAFGSGGYGPMAI